MDHSRINVSRWLASFATIALCVAVVVSGYLLVALILYEVTIPYVHDTSIFMSVGRALLNGRELYSEVFETKPPGIFVLTAMSLAAHDKLPALFDETTLLRLFHLAAYGGVLIASLRLRQSSSRYRIDRIHRFLFGVVMVVVISIFGGQGYPESFGAVFATAFVVSIVRIDDRPTWLQTAWLAVLFAAAVGFKEPFAVSLIAAGLICCRSWASLLRKVFVPGILAVVVGVAALSLFGWVDDYFQVYLPYMFLDRVPSYIHKSFVAHVLDFDWLVKSLWLLSPVLPVFFLSLIAGAVYVPGNIGQTLFRCIVVAIAVILGMAAIRIGGVLSPQYFVFTVPIIFALQAALQRQCAEHGCRGIGNVVTACLVCVIVTLPLASNSDRVVDFTKIGVSPFRERLLADDRQAHEDALAIDRIMETCGYATVSLLRPVESHFYAYLKHSPAGRDYLWRSAYMNDATDGSTSSAVLDALAHSQLVVFDLDERGLRILNNVEQYVVSNFSIVPPSCAFGTALGGVTVMFRDEPALEEKQRRLTLLGDRYVSEGRERDALSVFLANEQPQKARQIARSFVDSGRLDAAIDIYIQTGDEDRLVAIGEQCMRDECYETSLAAFSGAKDIQGLLNLADALEHMKDENAIRLGKRARLLAGEVIQDQSR